MLVILLGSLLVNDKGNAVVATRFGQLLGTFGSNEMGISKQNLIIEENINCETTLRMVLARCEFTGYISRCPTSFERRIFGGHKNCLTSNFYHCIRDERNRLVETCNKPQQIPPGNFPIYLHKSDDIYYVSCPKHLYQPFAVWSNEISDCMFVKSSCNSIGQVPCGNGNDTDDATCGCDYSKGYVVHGHNRCCSPSWSTECYCQYRTCENNLQELGQDYNCVKKCNPGYERSFLDSCEPTLSTARLQVHVYVNGRSDPGMFNFTWKLLAKY